MQAKKFDRKLHRETSFVFKDPKDADEFYYFLNKKLNLNHSNVGQNSAFELGGKTLYLSYNEIDKEDETLNIGLAFADALLEKSAGLTAFDNHYTSRSGHWYILITVYDENIKNCLLDHHPMKDQVILYLKALQEEYLTTHNYEELLLTKKS